MKPGKAGGMRNIGGETEETQSKDKYNEKGGNVPEFQKNRPFFRYVIYKEKQKKCQ
jgi:hypothetical protein